MKQPVKSFIKKHGWLKIWGVTIAVSAVLVVGGVWGLRTWYYHNLEPVSQSQQISYFTVEPGDNLNLIAKNLKQAGLIRSSGVFVTYVRSNALYDNLQAGTYALNPSMSSQEIVNVLVGGKVAKNLLTILPGKRLDQIKLAFAKAGYSETQIDKAFNPAAYRNHPALASLPPGATLEGYLYPDSFQQQSNTPAEHIIRQSLDEMQKYLTSDISSGFSVQGLNIFQGVTLASIVAKESSNPADQPTIAQVFLKRLAEGISLGSDVTAFYASAIAGAEDSLFIESPYNTRIHTGLPPGPIGNVTKNALRAAAQPSNTNYLFFVAGDDGTVHFTYTQAEHEAAVEKYCTTACGR